MKANTPAPAWVAEYVMSVGRFSLMRSSTVMPPVCSVSTTLLATMVGPPRITQGVGEVLTGSQHRRLRCCDATFSDDCSRGEVAVEAAKAVDGVVTAQAPFG